MVSQDRRYPIMSLTMTLAGHEDIISDPIFWEVHTPQM